MLCFPNCKINIGLYVTRRRDDGYHDIETVFYPIHQYDVLEAVPACETKLHLSGIAVAGNDTDNLVWKAYQLLKTAYPGKIPSLDIYLHKAIPMGAGLGGGSADGAFMLRLLNDQWRLELNTQQLASLALQLGSDCPFFIYNKPQHAIGRGEQLNDIPLDLSAYSIQLVCPKVHVSTAKAFSMLTPKPAAYDLRQLHLLSIEEWKNHISNDFETPVFLQHPALAGIKQQLYNGGALYAAMSGSGSAIYGVFPKSQKAEIKVDVPFDIFYIA